MKTIMFILCAIIMACCLSTTTHAADYNGADYEDNSPLCDRPVNDVKQ